MVALAVASAEFNESVSANGLPSAAWPIGFLVGLGLLVGLSVWAAPEDQVGPPADAGAAQAAATPTASRQSGQFDIFMPAADDVILGSCVPVAGRVRPPTRTSGPSQPQNVALRVLDGNRIVGEGTLLVANGSVVGCLAVEPTSRGRHVELLLSLTTHPASEHTRIPFILAANATTDP